MIKKNLFLQLFLALTITLGAQTNVTKHNAGFVFEVSLPDYMSKTIGLNSVASIQFKNVIKDVYGVIIADTREELALAEIKFSSVQEYANDFIKDFLKDEARRKISKPVNRSENGLSVVEYDASYYDKEAKMEIYYCVCLVESGNSYYKVMCWCDAAKKAEFKEDFRKIAYSIKD